MGIEKFIQQLRQQTSSPYMQQTGQPQIMDNMNSAILGESQQHIPSASSYNQSNAQTVWSNNASPWSQDGKPMINMVNHLGSPSSGPTSHHSSYGPSPTNTYSSPASNYSGSTNNFNNRPSPYPVPPHSHHMKYSSGNGVNSQQNMPLYQQVGLNC
jgi:hypothetical protein